MKRSNFTLRFFYILSFIACLAVVANVFVTNVFKIHLRSNTSLESYIQNMSSVTEVIHAKRGNIYSSTGEIIAQDESTYDIICYLSKSRLKANNEPAYVTDPLYTSQVLATILNGDQETIYSYLTQNGNLYQTEIGSIGRNISKETKELIDSYNLPGVDYRTSYARTYPENSNFAPYLIGYAQSDDTGKLLGKMGIEQYLNAELSGIDGVHTYQMDKNGYVLNGMYDEITEAKNGYDVYTTIDTSIQDALVASFDELAEGVGDTWGAVVEIETGKILAWAQNPSFDPNTLNFENYNNLGSQLSYEPGSVFKSFIYAAAIDSGNYDGSATYDSSSYCYLSNGNEPYRTYSDNNYGCISNANGKNWGDISLDYGLIYSSNVATSTLLSDYVGSETYLEYVKKFGFFKEVDTDGINEVTGSLNYTYPSEKLALTYGQGSSCTMLQLLQAYTAIFGNGEMVKPYFIDKIVDSDENKVIYQGSRKVVDRVISESTAKTMQDLLYQVVYAARGTASIYKVDEVEIMAKTGTAEKMQNGSYDKDEYINSVMLAFPYDNPKYMIYYAYVYPYDYGNVDNTGAIKDLIRRVALLTNVNYDSSKNISNKIVKYEMPNLNGKTYGEALDELDNYAVDVYKIGTGSTVIDTYPEYGEALYSRSKVFILTDGNKTVLPDFSGWTRKELISYWNLSNFAFSFDGFGIAYEQSISPGETVSKTDEVIIKFKQIESYIDTNDTSDDEQIE